YNALAGVVISASHNPVEYNGIKFFNENGFKLADEIEEEIENYILGDQEISFRPIKGEIGKVIVEDNGYKDYIAYLKSTIDNDLSGLKIAVDCGNGAVYKIAPELLKELGAEIVVISDEPNGVNINVECGSTNPSLVQSL